MIAVIYVSALSLGAMDAAVWQSFEWWQRLLRLCAVCGCGLLMYVSALFLVGFRVRDFRGPVARDSE